MHGDSHRTSGISALSSSKFYYTSPTRTPFVTGGHTEKDKFHRDNVSLRLGYDDSNKGIELLTSHSSKTVHYDNDSRQFEQKTAYDDRAHTQETLFKLSGYVGNDEELFKHKISISHIKTDNDTFDLYPYSNPYSAYDAKKQLSLIHI